MDKERQRQIELAALKYYNEVYSTKYSVECNFTHGAQWADEHPSGWHDLRKDPKDLPNNPRNVIICIEFNNGVIMSEVGFYDINNWMCNSARMRKRVIAWMEFPEFKD